MNYKKSSVAVMLVAILLVTGVTIAFATTPTEGVASSYAQKNYGPLMDFRFDGYENLTVGEYRRQVQEKVGVSIDEETYLKLMDAILGDETLRATALTDDDAFFLMNTLRLTGMDGWLDWYVDGSGTRGKIELGLDVHYTLNDPQGITIGQRDAAFRGMIDGAWAFLEGKMEEELADDTATNAALSQELLRLEALWETAALDLNTSGGYACNVEAQIQQAQQAEQREEQEARGQPGSQADYDMLLALMTDGWQNTTLADFSQLLFDKGWDEGFVAASERVRGDFLWNEVGVTLTDAQRQFLNFTLPNSWDENSCITKNEYDPSADYRPRYDTEWF